MEVDVAPPPLSLPPSFTPPSTKMAAYLAVIVALSLIATVSGTKPRSTEQEQATKECQRGRRMAWGGSEEEEEMISWRRNKQ